MQTEWIHLCVIHSIYVLCSTCIVYIMHNTRVDPVSLHGNLRFVYDTITVMTNRTWRWHTCDDTCRHRQQTLQVANSDVLVMLSLRLTNWASHHEDVWGSGFIAPRIPGLGTSWRWAVNFKPQPLYPGEKVPIFHWIGSWAWPEPVRKKWGGKKSCLYQQSNFDPSAVQPVDSPCTDCDIPGI
jgi:hypothetical protein